MKDKKKIGIITIHNSPNYGACLQSFALYEYLRQENFNVEIIDLHRPFHHDYIHSDKFKIFEYRFESLRARIKRILKSVLIKNNKPLNLYQSSNTDVISTPFDDFNSKIKLSPLYRGIDELYRTPPQYDIYITGSDQVWNPTQPYCIEPYFLTFVPPNSGKRISYASSIGIELLTSKEKRLFKKWLSKYDAISVREQSAANLLKRLTGRNISVVADPTFLLGKDFWNEMAVTPGIKDYILVFTLAFDQRVTDYAVSLGKELNKKVIVLNTVQPHSEDYISISNATPEEWLGFIKNADKIITDSFHCTVFSIILENPDFATYIAPWNDRGSRIRDLLDSLDLSDHLISDELIEKNQWINFQPVNQQSIASILNNKRESSANFLKLNISGNNR